MNSCREKEVTDQKTAYYWEKVREYSRQYENFDWSATELLLNIAYTNDIVLSHAEASHKEFGLSVSSMNILMILKVSQGEGYQQQALGRLLLVSRANVTKVIDGLEKRGLVARQPFKEDRRAWIIKLTPAGEALTNRIIPKQIERTKQIVAGLTRQEIKFLSDLLAKFRNQIIESGK